MSQTRAQQRFSILEVAANWHDLMMLWCIMWPFIFCSSKQLDPWSTQRTHNTPPQSATQGFHPVACKLLIVLTCGGWLGWVYLGGWLHAEMFNVNFLRTVMQDSKIFSLQLTLLSSCRVWFSLECILFLLCCYYTRSFHKRVNYKTAPFHQFLK